jgi:hypothetical protein
MPTANEVTTSLELRFLIDRHLAARHAGHHNVANVYAHAAEGVLTAAMPAHANAIASVASRKGEGRTIGSTLAQRLTPASAAAVNVIWLIRGARRPAIDAMAQAFREDVVFNDTIRTLCARVLPPAASTGTVKAEPIEMSAAYRR